MIRMSSFFALFLSISIWRASCVVLNGARHHLLHCFLRSFFCSRPNELWVSANDFFALCLLLAASVNEWKVMFQFEIVDDTFQSKKDDEMSARFSLGEFKNVCAVVVYGGDFIWVAKCSQAITDRIVCSFFFKCKTMKWHFKNILIIIHEMNPRNDSQWVFHR